MSLILTVCKYRGGAAGLGSKGLINVIYHCPFMTDY